MIPTNLKTKCLCESHLAVSKAAEHVASAVGAASAALTIASEPATSRDAAVAAAEVALAAAKTAEATIRETMTVLMPAMFAACGVPSDWMHIKDMGDALLDYYASANEEIKKNLNAVSHAIEQRSPSLLH